MTATAAAAQTVAHQSELDRLLQQAGAPAAAPAATAAAPVIQVTDFASFTTTAAGLVHEL